MADGDGDPITPGAFLGVAERLGLVHAIDRWVVDRGAGAARTTARPAARGQPLGALARRPPAPRRDPRGADPRRRRCRAADLRDHGDGGDRQHRGRAALRRGAQRARLRVRPRRLRHRLRLLPLPQAPAGRVPEDRRRVRPFPAQPHGRAGDRVDRPHRPGPRQADDRRVGGGRRQPGGAARGRRRLRAGLPRRPPAPGERAARSRAAAASAALPRSRARPASAARRTGSRRRAGRCRRRTPCRRSGS